MPVSPQEQGKVEQNEPILANDTEAALNALDRLFDTGKKSEIKEGRRIEFYEGKRKLANGELKKTGHRYWQWAYKSPDTGKRVRPYGGKIETVPTAYQYRRGQYEARHDTRGAESLADTLFRPALAGVRNGDTGTE